MKLFRPTINPFSTDKKINSTSTEIEALYYNLNYINFNENEDEQLLRERLNSYTTNNSMNKVKIHRLLMEKE